MGILPEPVEALLETALVSELTVVDPSGRPVTHPLIPFYDGQLIYLTSSILFSKKLEHIKANPKVSLSITDPAALEPARSPGRRSRATPRSTTRPPRRLGARASALAEEGARDRLFLGKRVASLFFERSVIEIRPEGVPVGGRTHRPAASGLRSRPGAA